MPQDRKIEAVVGERSYQLVRLDLEDAAAIMANPLVKDLYAIPAYWWLDGDELKVWPLPSEGVTVRG
jgi:hypothetical protein